MNTKKPSVANGWLLTRVVRVVLLSLIILLTYLAINI